MATKCLIIYTRWRPQQRRKEYPSPHPHSSTYSVDVTPDPPIFSLVTTFKMEKSGHILQQKYILSLFLNRHFQIVRTRGLTSITVVNADSGLIFNVDSGPSPLTELKQLSRHFPIQ
jgi:hypothetical protein